MYRDRLETIENSQSTNSAKELKIFNVYSSLGLWKIMAAVTSGLLTIVKTGITIVSYFGNVTACLFALTIVRKFTPR